MISVDMNESGTVVVGAGTPSDKNFLKKLPYLSKRGGRHVCWWTYIPDLRRHLQNRGAEWSENLKLNLRQVVSDQKSIRTGDDSEINNLFNKSYQPYPFQLEGIHFGLNRRRILIADDTGLGKTIQTIGIMAAAMARGHVARSVLVVPAGLKLQWYEQVYDFLKSDYAPAKPVVIEAGKGRQRRIKAYKSDWNLMIINPELVRQDHEYLRRIDGIDFVALDEAACIKNFETPTTKLIKAVFKSNRYKLALTATPIENKLQELYSIFDWVDPRVFPSLDYFKLRYIKFRRRWMKVKNRHGRQFKIPKEEVVRYRNLGEVRQKIRPCYIRRRVSDVGAELPELVVQWQVVNLTKSQRKIYRKIKDEQVEENGNLRGQAAYAPLQMLRQVCNSTALVEKISRGKPSQPKIDRLIELLDTELAGEQVIVFTDYEKFTTILKDALSRKFRCCIYSGEMNAKDKARSLRAFKAGDRQIMIATSAGERGHNLQNASIVVNIDLPFNPASMLQRLGRVRRIGSKHSTVRMINFVASGTIEETLIMKKIYTKRKLFESVLGDNELTDDHDLDKIVEGNLRKFL